MTSATDRAKPRRRVSALYSPWVITLAAAGLVGVHLLTSSQFAWWQRGIAALPGVAALFALGRYLRRRPVRLPFLEVALLQFYLFWGMPVLFESEVWGLKAKVAASAVTVALLLVILLVVTFLPGFWAGARIGERLRGSIARLLPPEMGPAARHVVYVWFGVALVVQAGAAHRLPPQYHNIIVVLGSYYPVLAYAALLGRRSPRYRWMLPAFTVALAFAGLFTGMLETVLRPLLVSGVLYLVVLRRFPLRWAMAFVAIFVILHPAKFIYRQMAWYEGTEAEKFDLEIMIDRWWYSIKRTWLADQTEGETEDQFQSLTGRFNELELIAVTVQATPKSVPHTYGDQWKYILVSPIPRLLYPGKPDRTQATNDRFHLAYGLATVASLERSTFAFPLVADGYWALGWFGVGIVGLLVGLLLGFYARGLTIYTWGGLSVGLACFGDLRAVAHLTEHYSSILQRGVGVAVVCWFVYLITGGLRREAGSSARPAGPTGPSYS